MKVKADALLEGCTLAGCQGAYGIAVVPEDDGWGLWTRGESQISVAQVRLPATAFPDGYTKLEGGFSIKQSFFHDALVPGTEPDISVEPGKITITNDRRKQSTRLDGRDVQEYVRNMPNYSPDATMAIMSDELTRFFKQKQIKDFKGINGVKLTLSEDGMTASTIDDISSFEDFLPCDTVVVPEGGTHANFNVDMLVPMIMAMPKGALVTLGFNTNSPIELTVSTENVEARILLAPMIADDEE